MEGFGVGFCHRDTEITEAKAESGPMIGSKAETERITTKYAKKDKKYGKDLKDGVWTMNGNGRSKARPGRRITTEEFAGAWHRSSGLVAGGATKAMRCIAGHRSAMTLPAVGMRGVAGLVWAQCGGRDGALRRPGFGTTPFEVCEIQSLENLSGV